MLYLLRWIWRGSTCSEFFWVRPFIQKLRWAAFYYNTKQGLRRSSKSYELRQQWHDAQDSVSGEAFRDRLISETVCLTTIDEVVKHLAANFEQAAAEAVLEVEPGLVLRNPLGQGAFQTIQVYGGVSTGTKLRRSWTASDLSRCEQFTQTPRRSTE